MSFEYFLSGKEGLIVISFKGDLDDTSGLQLMKCLEDISTNAPAGAVVHMAEVSLSKGGYRAFSQFLRELKSKCVAVRISAMNSTTKATLIQGGLLSIGEARDTLVEALKEVAFQIRTSK